MMKPTFSHKPPLKVEPPKYKVAIFQGGPWSDKRAIMNTELEVTFSFKVGKWCGRYKKSDFQTSRFLHMRWEPRYIANEDNTHVRRIY